MERTAPVPAPRAEGSGYGSLAAELRESLLLLTLSVGVTAAVTAAAQATAAHLG